MTRILPLALCLAACSGGDDDPADGDTQAPPYPDCVTIEAGGTTQELVRRFDDAGHVVEETLDGASVATYTYDGPDLATKTTPTETWAFTWGPDGIASIDVTDASGADAGEYVYFYDASGQLTDIALRLPDGTTEQTLQLAWVDATTSDIGFEVSTFVASALAPPLSDPLRDPAGLVVTDVQSGQGTPIFERDVDADGVPTEERVYDRGTLAETRSWGFCGG